MAKCYKIFNKSSGMVLGVDPAELKPGNIITAYTYGGVHKDVIVEWSFEQSRSAGTTDQQNQNTESFRCVPKDWPNLCMELRGERLLVLGKVDDSKDSKEEQKWTREGLCIRSKSNPNMVLGISESEANIKMAPKNKLRLDDKQIWIIRNAVFHGTKTYYIMASKKNGMALGVESKDPKPGTKIPSYLLKDDDKQKQEWCFDQDTETIRCKLSNELCMEVTDEGILTLEKFDATKPEQKWKRRGKYIQSCTNKGMTLHISEEKVKTENKTSGTEKQKWNFRNALFLESKNHYTIVNKCNGLALGIPTAEPGPGEEISAYELVYGNPKQQWWIDDSTKTIRCTLSNDLCIERKGETLILGVFDYLKHEQQWIRKEGNIRSRKGDKMVIEISEKKEDKTATGTSNKTQQQGTIPNECFPGSKTYHIMDSKFNSMAFGVCPEDPGPSSKDPTLGSKIISSILDEDNQNQQWCFHPNNATIHCKGKSDLCMEVLDGRILTVGKFKDFEKEPKKELRKETKKEPEKESGKDQGNDSGKDPGKEPKKEKKYEQQWTRLDGYIRSFANPKIVLHISEIKEIKENGKPEDNAPGNKKQSNKTEPESSMTTHSDATPPGSEPGQNNPPDTLPDTTDPLPG